jgi:hypothetical protein
VGNSTGKITFHPVSPDLRILTLVMNAVAVAVAEKAAANSRDEEALNTGKVGTTIAAAYLPFAQKRSI